MPKLMCTEDYIHLPNTSTLTTPNSCFPVHKNVFQAGLSQTLKNNERFQSYKCAQDILHAECTSCEKEYYVWC